MKHIAILISFCCALNAYATTVTLTLDPGAGHDCEVYSLQPTTNYVSDLLRGNAWTFGGSTGYQRAYFQFSGLSSVPQSAIITSAYLSLYCPPSPSSQYQSGTNASWLMRVNSSWDETTLTWNTQPSTCSLHQVSLPTSTSQYQDYTNIDVTALVQDMVNDPSNSYGFLLKLQTEGIYRRMSFCSKDYSDYSKHPVLVITYCQQYSADWGEYFTDDFTDAYANSNYAYDNTTEQLAVDTTDESVYVVGSTTSLSGQQDACPNLYYSGQSGANNDGYLIKLDKCGNKQWVKYFGTDLSSTSNKNGEIPTCIAIDHDAGGSTIIYVAGYIAPFSGSTSATAQSCSGGVGVFQSTFNGSGSTARDGFIAKYDASGNLLRWTYFGGTAKEYLLGIEVFNHDVFITGDSYEKTTSWWNFGSVQSYDASPSVSGGTTFIAQLDQDLSQLKFFSYIDGSNSRGHSIKHAVVNGTTYMAVSGTTSGALQNNYGTLLQSYLGNDDAFIVTWQASGNTYAPIWNRHIGGASADRGRQLDFQLPDGGFIMNCWNESTNAFTSTNCFQSSNAGNKDAYLIKFDLSGNILWATYFGGNDEDAGSGVLSFTLNGENYIAFCGWTRSTNSSFPLKNEFQSQLNGGVSCTTGASVCKDAYVAILNDPANSCAQQTLFLSSYYGGSKDEYSNSTGYYGPYIAFGNHKEIYLDFHTKSKTSYVNSAGYYTNILNNSGSDDDIFVARILGCAFTNQYDCTTWNWRIDSSHSKIVNNTALFPNPTVDISLLTINSSLQCNASFQIFSAYGQRVTEFTSTLYEGENKIEISLKSLPSGVYLVQTIYNGQAITYRLVKQ